MYKDIFSIGIISMASICQASLSMDVAGKYGGGLTFCGHLDVKPASQLPIFSHAETIICSCKFNRNSVARNCSPTWFRASPNRQHALTDVLNSELWGCLSKIRNSGKRVGNCKQGKVGWSVVCSSNGERSPDDYGLGGDRKTQDILAEIVKLEVSKVRTTELIDESSQNITNIALQTQLEYAQLAATSAKKLDASGSQVLVQLDASADAFQQELHVTNAMLEEQSRIFEEFQILSKYARNDGLFFKNLYKAPRALTYQTKLTTLAKETAVVSTSITPKDYTRSYKQILYGGISLVFLSFMWSSGSALISGTYMRSSKLVSYAVIMSLLLTQLAYAKVLTGEVDTLNEIGDISEADAIKEIEDKLD